MARNNEETQRKCKKCNEEKPISSFVKNKRCLEGRTYECTSCRNEYMGGIYKQETYNTKRKHLLKKNYGMTLEDYNKMWIEQSGKCAICGKHEQELDTVLCVDHCHTTGKVRGLLCSKCNAGIGLLQDDFNVVLSAAKYLEDK